MRAGGRRSLLKRVAVALLAGVVLLGVYGVLIEPRLILDERHHTAPIPALPSGWQGGEVAVFSDPQVGMWWANTGMVERVVERVVDEDPRLLLLAGDFVYSTDPGVDAQVETVLELLAPVLDAGIPTVAVLGNHDYAVGAAEELTTALEAAGVRVLLNESTAVEGLHVVGIGPVVPGLADPDAALAGVPEGAPRVVLMHNPTAFPELPAGSAPLAVAGHTHCGQVALPGTPRWSYVALTEEEAIVADGYAPSGYGEPGNVLFVTCGIGFSLLPVRINAAPQLVFFELEAA